MKEQLAEIPNLVVPTMLNFLQYLHNESVPSFAKFTI